MNPDKTDMAILALLQQNGRLTNSSIASELALSETPCWRRIKKLEDSGLIQGYQANLNRKQLGFGVMAFVQLTYVMHDVETTKCFEETILRSDNVLSCHNTTGQADFLLQVVAKDLEEYSHFVESVLRKLPGVSAISSNISLRELKSTSKLPVLPVPVTKI